MKKQLYRVKQLADQRVGRAEKTDLLTEDLQHVEKTVEKIKVACTTTSKKLNMCMLSSGPDAERRKKKLNQLQLALGMLECANILGDASVLGSVLLQGGETQSALAGELATYETQIDESILAPLQKIVETDIPNIGITKKRLSKARLDMDASKTRWSNAVKLANTAKGNTLEAHGKAELLKSEFEDNSAMFQSLQDTLATEMFTFVAGESTYADWIIKLLESQMKYHQASLDLLKKCIPNVKKELDESMFRPVFGCQLDVHLSVTDREIAVVLEECVLFLLENAMDIEGLFRLAGSASKIKKLKAAFDAGLVEMEDYTNEIHTVTGVLKLYLRELPEPLLTYALYDEWIAATKIKDRDQKLQQLWTLLNNLPETNKTNLRYLVCFLAKLSEQSEVNKMSPSNIAIVIGPNLLWQEGDNSLSIAHTGNISIILESFIEHCKWFFPEGCEFTRHQMSPERLDAITNRFAPKEIEPLTSPEIPSLVGGGSLFSEVSKKLGWKEDKNESSTVGQGTGQTPHSFYNPLAAQYDPDLDNSENTEPSLPQKPVVTKKPSSPPASDVAPPYTSHHKSTSSISSIERSSSTGSNSGDSHPPTHKRQNSSSAPRRPAPPIPKVPPGGPPKSKPPDPPGANGIPVSPKMRAPDLPTTPKPKLSSLAQNYKNNDDKPG